MKTNCLYAAMYCIFLSACDVAKSDTEKFIPGTYTASFKDSISLVYDTFYINVLTSSGSDQYEIINSLAYQQTIDGQLQPPNKKMHKWTGTYDDKFRTVSVNQTGSTLAFDPLNDEMKLGTVSYKKVRQ